MAELAIDDLNVRIPGGIHLRVAQGYPGLVKVRGADSIIPGRPGRVVRDREEDTLGFVLDGDVSGADEAAFMANLADLSSACSPMNLVTVTLDDGYLGAAGVTISARCLNAILSDLEEGVHWQHWNVEFEAVDPPAWES